MLEFRSTRKRNLCLDSSLRYLPGCKIIDLHSHNRSSAHWKLCNGVLLNVEISIKLHHDVGSAKSMHLGLSLLSCFILPIKFLFTMISLVLDTYLPLRHYELQLISCFISVLGPV